MCMASSVRWLLLLYTLSLCVAGVLGLPTRCSMCWVTQPSVRAHVLGPSLGTSNSLGFGWL